MEQLKPNKQRAKNAILLIWVVLAIDMISLFSSILQYNLLETASNGGEISLEYANSNDLRERIIGIIQLIISIISAITFILWFRRAYYNLHLRLNYLSHNEGWAAGSWFVPIISLFRPFQIMKELYYETKLYLMKHGIISDEDISTNTIGIWWSLWIINNIISQYIFKNSLKAETVDEFMTCTIANMLSSLICIPLAIITVKIIKEYSRIEPLLNKVAITEVQ